MKVLLTGANGFVGSHILDRLIAAGVPAVLWLRPRSETGFIAGHLPAVEVRRGTLNDAATLQAALAGVTEVIHCAGATRGLRREELFAANQAGTRKLVQAVNDAGGQVRRFLYLSSLAAGRPGTRVSPAREDDPPAPRSVYGESKRAGELEVANLCRVPFTILRPGGVYGPRDREFLRLFKAAQIGFSPLFGGGRQELSLVFAPDLADVVVRVLDTPSAAQRTLNVAGDEVVTARELALQVASTLRKGTFRLWLPRAALNLVCLGAATWANLTRRPTILAHGKQGELTAPGWVADVTGLRTVLGGVCPTRIEDGLEATRRWYAGNGWL